VPKKEVIARVDAVRTALGGAVPVTTGEPWHIWTDNLDLAAAVDLIFINIHPYWERQSIDDAVAFVLEKYLKVKQTYPDKRVVISEVGWPSAGNANVAAQPSIGNQERFVRELVAMARKHNIEFFFFEAIDEPWKTAEPNGVGPHWGLFDANRTPKHPQTRLNPPDPINDRVAAIMSAIISVLTSD
jgi:exo-beta-1,3-glucanase (GH17 family)